MTQKGKYNGNSTETKNRMQELRKKILIYLANNPHASRTEIAEGCNMSTTNINHAMKNLIRNKLVIVRYDLLDARIRRYAIILEEFK